MLTKRQAVELFGTQAELARQLGIQRAAVCKWPWDEPIAEGYYLKIRFVLLPERFASSNSPRGVWTEA